MQVNKSYILIIFVSVVLTFLTNFGLNYSFLEHFLFLKTTSSGNEMLLPSLETTYLVANEWWRLITPTFLHFSITHLVFNCLWIYILGSRIELLDGRLIFLFIFFVTGIISNVGEFMWSGAYLFGGLSGAVYGLLGYCFIVELDNNQGRYGLPEALYLFMFIWLLVGYTGILKFFGFGNVANTAHLVGMITGFIIGFISKYIFIR